MKTITSREQIAERLEHVARGALTAEPTVREYCKDAVRELRGITDRDMQEEPGKADVSWVPGNVDPDDPESHWVYTRNCYMVRKSDHDTISAKLKAVNAELVAALEAIEAYEDAEPAAGTREAEIATMRRAILAKARG